MLTEGLWLAISFKNIFIGIIGTGIGMVVGALPGLGASVAMALALPLTFGWSADSAIILLMALYCGATYGGSISAILLNTPGTPASGATTFDGFPMAQQGKADIALGLSTMSSFIGGIIGGVLLFTVAPMVTRLVLSFGPAEMFLISIFSLTIIGALGEDKLLKGLISCGIGLCISFIGVDVMTGYKRFSFGSYYLQDGINSVVVMIGVFAIAEMIKLMEKKQKSISEVANPGTIRNVLKGCIQVFKYPINLIRSSIIGSIIGALPALGVTTASFLSYMMAVNSSKNPEEFGKGVPEGIIAPEAANNAVTATALIPTLTLGIPGSSVMAIILGALTIQGIVPGADIFKVNAHYTYSVLWAIFFINIYMLIIGVLGAGWISRITIVPSSIIVPSVIVFCFIGSFALNMLWQDIVCAVIFGLVGYIFKKHNYSILGLLLGLILGPIAESSFHQALRISGGSYGIFTSSSICKVLIVCIILSILLPIYKMIRKRQNLSIKSTA